MSDRKPKATYSAYVEVAINEKFVKLKEMSKAPHAATEKRENKPNP
jgi:hypothetical protein